MKDYTILAIPTHKNRNTEKIINKIFADVKKEFPDSIIKWKNADLPYYEKTPLGYITGKLREYEPKAAKKSTEKDWNVCEIILNNKPIIRFYKYSLNRVGFIYHKDLTDEQTQKIKNITKEYNADFKPRKEIRYFIIGIIIAIILILLFVLPTLG